MENEVYCTIRNWAIVKYGNGWQRHTAADIGIHESTMSRLRYKKRLALETSMRLSKLSGIPLSELGYAGISVTQEDK